MFEELTIKEIMKRERLNITEIAHRTGLSIPYISKLKNNRIVASEEAQNKVFLAFGYYVANEEIKYKNECDQLRYKLYEKQLQIMQLEKENATLKNAIKKCYEVIENER